MPIYSFKCTTCDVEVELLQKINDNGSPDCIKCGNVMKKILSIPSRSMREYDGGIVDYDIDGTRKVFNTYEALKKAGKAKGLELI